MLWQINFGTLSFRIAFLLEWWPCTSLVQGCNEK